MNKQIILSLSDVKKLLLDIKFSDIEEYLSYIKSCGISPYKKDIKKSPFFGSGLGSDKMNHYSIKGSGGNFRFYITNKRIWLLNKIKHGV